MHRRSPYIGALVEADQLSHVDGGPQRHRDHRLFEQRSRGRDRVGGEVPARD